MTLRRSKVSIVRETPRDGLKSILRWKEPEPAVALYHWSEACWYRKGRETCKSRIIRWDGKLREYSKGKRRKTYVCVEHRGEIDPGHQQIVAHVVLALYAGGGTEIGADGDIRSTRDIAGLSKMEVKEGGGVESDQQTAIKKEKGEGGKTAV
jgi:hypothetical protein